MATTERYSEAVSYRGIDGWQDKFATNVHGIMAPSRGGIQWPHLHKVLRSRAAEGVRYGELSRCNCKINIPFDDPVRTDSNEYQNRALFHPDPDGKVLDRHLNALQVICPDIHKRFVIYGFIGGGTFGVVFAAREREPEDPDNVKHYALKIEPHTTMEHAIRNKRHPTMACWDDIGGRLRYIPTEAMVMRFLTGSGRFPVIDSVYTHEHYQVTVMSAAGIDYDPRREIYDRYSEGERYPSFSGGMLIYRKKPLLKEIEVCKIASQMLEAMMYLMDMNMSHDDLSHNNYVVNESLDVLLLDFGLMTFALDGETGFQAIRWAWVPYQEYQVSPELAIELSKEYWSKAERDREKIVHLPHDARIEHLWKLGCIFYDLLHGYSAWEERTWVDNIGSIRDWVDNQVQSRDASWRKAMERRDRIINEELPIDEDLSQDCVDVLRAMFTKEPEKRPTLRQLASFPWFQGHWVNEGQLRRPGSDWPDTPYESPESSEVERSHREPAPGSPRE